MDIIFYESSTRTRKSFEVAMKMLGGQATVTENAKEFSSAAKGETLEDTVRVIEAYSDIIVLRHPDLGSSELASKLVDIPVINAGDGKGQHPTQALLDVYTIWKEFGKVDGLRVAMIGDLANGRTVRSLAYLSAKFNKMELTFVSPPNLNIGNDIKSYLIEHNLPFTEENDFNSVIPEVDVIYMTRIQKERMSPEDYNKSKGKYILNQKNLKLVRKDARILHPLPHVEEISLPITIEENDPRVAYFRQAENGLYTRMALLHHLLA